MKLKALILAQAAIFLSAMSASADIAAPIRGFTSAEVHVQGAGASVKAYDYNEGFSLGPVTLINSATQKSFGDDNVAVGTTNVTANWSSMDAGTIDIDFQDLILDSGLIDNDQSSYVHNFDSIEHAWEYRFTPNVDSVFSLNYAFETTFTGERLNYGNIAHLQVNGVDQPFIGNNGVGILSYDLIAGRIYTFDISPEGILESKSSGSLNASQRYTFAITALSPTLPGSSPTPEPATWALMLVGFGLLGGAMRRSRARATCIDQPWPGKRLT